MQGNGQEVEIPTPVGAVDLCTTIGRLRVQLFSEQCPRAASCFVQLCLDGAYNDTRFHRLIPGFTLQGGDPTGSGTGLQLAGHSDLRGAHTNPIEVHPRLRYQRKGMVGVAINGTSQFFITLMGGEIAERSLFRKTACFGMLTGDAVYALQGVPAEARDDGSPARDIVIREAVVVQNPFPHLTPRERAGVPRAGNNGGTPAESAAPGSGSLVRRKRKRRRGDAPVRDNNLLSFADDEDDPPGPGGSVRGTGGAQRVGGGGLANPSLIDARAAGVDLGAPRHVSPEIPPPERGPAPCRDADADPASSSRDQIAAGGDHQAAQLPSRSPDQTALETSTAAPHSVSRSATVSAISESDPRLPPAKEDGKSKPRGSVLAARLAKYASKRGKRAHDEEDTLAKFEAWRRRSGR